MVIKSSRAFTGAAAVAVLATAGVAHAFSVPNFKGTDGGIASPGYPDFWSANLSGSLSSDANTGDYTLRITGSNPNVGIFNFPSAAYVVGNEQIKLTANFDKFGNLLSGSTYEIDGSLKPSSSPDYGSAPKGFSWSTVPTQMLFKTSLTGVTVDSTDEALGFKSTNFSGWADQKQFTGGSTTESVWLYSLLTGTNWSDSTNKSNAAWNSFLAAIKNHSKLSGASFAGLASIATVPLPAALWLFGSGLAALGGMLRRRPAQASQPVVA